MTRVPQDRRHKYWATPDGKHAGWVGVLFGDGATSVVGVTAEDIERVAP